MSAKVQRDMRSQTCRICGVKLESEAELGQHLASLHNVQDNDDPESGHIQARRETLDEVESQLRKRASEEEKARKRTRGPYRKSVAQ